jgi:geranylgeranyl pyrophosphate synthase
MKEPYARACEALISIYELILYIEGDIEETLAIVQRSQGLKRCRDLAHVHIEMAIESISVIESSQAKDGLIALACKIITLKS